MLKPLLVKRSGWEEFGKVLQDTMVKLQKQGNTVKDVQYHPISILGSRCSGIGMSPIPTSRTEFTAVIFYEDNQNSIHTG